VAGQVERVDGVAARQRLLHEQPRVLVAAEAVHQDDGYALAEHRVRDGPAADVDGVHARAGDLGDHTGRQFGAGRGDGRLDLVVGYGRRRDDRDRRADRYLGRGVGHHGAQDAVER
jgi:hypothetical protein